MVCKAINPREHRHQSHATHAASHFSRQISGFVENGFVKDEKCHENTAKCADVCRFYHVYTHADAGEGEPGPTNPPGRFRSVGRHQRQRKKIHAHGNFSRRNAPTGAGKKGGAQKSRHCAQRRRQRGQFQRAKKRPGTQAKDEKCHRRVKFSITNRTEHPFDQGGDAGREGAAGVAGIIQIIPHTCISIRHLLPIRILLAQGAIIRKMDVVRQETSPKYYRQYRDNQHSCQPPDFFTRFVVRSLHD